MQAFYYSTHAENTTYLKLGTSRLLLCEILYRLRTEECVKIRSLRREGGGVREVIFVVD